MKFLNKFLTCFVLISAVPSIVAFSNQGPMKVLVTGAAGKTGRLVLKRLEESPFYEPKALVRTERSASQLLQEKDIHCPLEHVVISDITSPTFEDSLPNGLFGMDAMIICTSAVPRISRRSLAGAVLKAPWNIIRRRKPVDFRQLQFKWKHGGYPEKVDFHGQVAQIDLAKKLGMRKVVVISSMGGTKPDHFLNRVGENKDGSGNGKILFWKRRAEKYLIESGLDYAILHPGGLMDGPGGQEHFVLDVDDKIVDNFGKTRISRDDVADLCMAALETNKNCSFDCITLPRLDNGKKVLTAKESLAAFMDKAATSSYTL